MARNTSIRSVEQLTAILNSVPTAVIVVDGSGAMVLVNAQAEQLFGYSSTELLGESVDILLPYRFRAGHPDMRAGFMCSPKTRPMGAGRDLFGLRKDGTEFPIEIGLNPIATNDDTLVVSAIVDMTERKRMEARFRATIESAPTAMVMIDQTGTVLQVNAEIERLFGYRREELLQRKVEALIPERFQGGHPGQRARFFTSPEARRMGAGRDLFALRKDGTEFPVEIGLSPVRTDEGLFVLAAIVDISERKRLADATLQRANEALERSNIELQRFAYVASHDLQTPMRNVASFVELLQTSYQDRLDAQANDWIRRIVQSVKQLQTLVRDLLEYSRVDSQAHPFEPVAGREIFDAAVALLESSISACEADVSCGDLPVVTGDRSQLVQVLINLIGNSLKYRGNDPPIVRVTARAHEGNWLFAVQDNGIGIEPRYRERIFEIFERLHEQRLYPGSGIGLAVCRRVIHRHGGCIWTESGPGRGSIFYFTIPQQGENGHEQPG
ncbi:sensor histidine kinase [Marinobacterium aestuariivivens]|uniref:histidine kinase n=1 Tax=Marinobacterium aestuariivivens TaxID=1698799 RepID=A0ABW2A077_9GAMM